MNSFLLDTNALLWWLENNQKLTSRQRKVIENPRNSIFVSSVCVWEISIKKATGKLKAPNDLVRKIKENKFFELRVSFEHALKVEDLPEFHNDPFDHLLIAQAMVEKMTVLTSDKRFKEYKVKVI